MKLSDTMYKRAEHLWKEAAEKPFVVQMAKGTLDPERFRHYMMQDYLYLLDYIGILTQTAERAADPGLKGFLQELIEATRNETERVHVPNMRAIGIRDEDLADCREETVISEYVGYMKRQLEEEGLIAGLTALLQCSWVYAYIGQVLTERYPEDIAVSPYRSWFEAYTCREYIESNQKWIDVLDREAEGASPEESEMLGQIFQKCAEFENRLWDALYA